MAVISTITIGSDVFSVYALTADPVADADSYLAARIGETWSGASTLNKQQALISAARMLDRAVLWSGIPTVEGQAREWPRDGATCNGDTVTNGTIPDDIATAEFELANILFLDATVQDTSSTGSNTKSVKTGSVKIEFFNGADGSEPRLPATVNDLIVCYIDVTSGITTAFGVDDSDNDPGYDKDCFDLNQGLP